ncbi:MULTISPECIES: DUF262 domain-containing protein [unclassified Oceanispirochaeta]|uniref:DUF262 domain-containing protein n=1 Tax=unclassified Oceanispirochaeta TaxID=2635722 RepID=UPI000E095CF9|nr:MULTISPECIES: DUF262 domain-containing protein [unclassified Oceanispirochaeta]MBF9015165.1 DUF262 domain-containing protein [Oceanispirochaeta sp. M2]NPD71623.1 DUF262 domain-containing protein [Oceanispirochaeta sp. M1]RDG33189.1 DUF262 domain-containing protein [Oceanispirochaeta sp. M1]
MSSTNKYSLLDLLDGTIAIESEGSLVFHDMNGIEIPIIQRDYAQGRDSARYIRKRFLNAIFEALENRTILELDFVYGSIKEVEDNSKILKTFIPLDGQQRLTTLYLLYWFIANKELSGDRLQQERSKLRKFSYSTRSTARSFCEKLSEIGYSGSVKTSITSSYWFHKTYENDPTVMGMIATLHDIQNRYISEQPLYENLPQLCFYIMPLEGFDLTDELYIKMNARGKSLTDFENFKADILSWMKSEKNPEKKDYERQVMMSGKLVPRFLAFASKMDNSWTDIFWEKAKSNSNEKDRIVDPYFFRFIKRFLLNDFIITSTESNASIEDSSEFRLLYSTGHEEKTKYLTFEDYKGFIVEKRIANLERIFDLLSKNQASIKEIILPPWDREDIWFLYDDLISQPQRLLFFAVTRYLENCTDFDKDKFSNWIRVVWNIIADPDIRSISSMITAMKTIDRISAGSNSIHAFFEEGKFDRYISDLTNIHKDQLQEEKLKIDLFRTDGWKDRILEAESHHLFQGNIGFLLQDINAPEAFAKKLEQAQILYSQNDANTDFLSNHELFRYCISKIETWDNLEKLNLRNEILNWRLYLRRNRTFMQSVSDLCSMSRDEISRTITEGLKKNSQIEGWNRERLQLVHSNIYKSKDFFDWADQNKLSTIRWRYELYYFVRPNAWYDKVLIDGYRNIVIHEFCIMAGLDNSYHRCNQSDFFWGEQIDFPLENEDVVVSFTGENVVEIQTRTADDWTTVYSDMIEVNNHEDAKDFAKNIWTKCDSYL